MFKYKKGLYDICSDTTQETLRLFCDKINNSNADVFVLMAHKATLLFQVLMEQKYISSKILKEKIIISNLALEFDCSFLYGKKISIIDDIIISGTSIATTIENLRKLGVSLDDISVIALSMDKKYLSMNFDIHENKSILKCDTEMEDSTCIELSSFLSNAFAYYGIPYNVDFPSYNSFSLNDEEISVFFNNFLWKIVKVSENYPMNSNVVSYTLFPTNYVRKMLWERIGINLEKCTHLKIRTYVKSYPNGRKECHIMPLCIIDGISEKNLNIIYNLFKPKKDKIKFSKNSTIITKMRYLQFYIAHHFALFLGKLHCYLMILNH